jgi:hypothetical protein
MCGAVHISIEEHLQDHIQVQAPRVQVHCPSSDVKEKDDMPLTMVDRTRCTRSDFKPIIKHNQSGVSKELPCAGSVARRNTEPDKPVDRRWCI